MGQSAADIDHVFLWHFTAAHGCRHKLPTQLQLFVTSGVLRNHVKSHYNIGRKSGFIKFENKVRGWFGAWVLH